MRAFDYRAKPWMAHPKCAGTLGCPARAVGNRFHRLEVRKSLQLFEAEVGGVWALGKSQNEHDRGECSISRATFVMRLPQLRCGFRREKLVLLGCGKGVCRKLFADELSMILAYENLYACGKCSTAGGAQ